MTVAFISHRVIKQSAFVVRTLRSKKIMYFQWPLSLLNVWLLSHVLYALVLRVKRLIFFFCFFVFFSTRIILLIWNKNTWSSCWFYLIHHMWKEKKKWIGNLWPGIFGFLFRRHKVYKPIENLINLRPKDSRTAIFWFCITLYVAVWYTHTDKPADFSYPLSTSLEADLYL